MEAAGVEQPARASEAGVVTAVAAGLVAPDLVAPGLGELTEVSPGVLWSRMPMPPPLGHVNVWLLRDDVGWAVVDTGVANAITKVHWERVFEALPPPRRTTRVFATHMHADHAGLAGWFFERFGASVWMTRTEFLMAKAIFSEQHLPASPEGRRFYRAAGWSEALSARRLPVFEGPPVQAPLPEGFRRIRDGEPIRIGDLTWRMVVCAGHTPESASLYCVERGLLITGDQVLPGMTANVSLYPWEPEDDPIADWLDGVLRMKAAVPDDVIVMPGHRDCFVGLHGRLDAMIETHEARLERLRALLSSPRRAVDVFSALVRRPVTEESGLVFDIVTGEALAYLAYLRHAGEIEVEEDEHGVQWRRLADVRGAPRQPVLAKDTVK